MKAHPSNQDISAYIDEEYGRPAWLASHLQKCAACAKRHVELSKLSSHVRSLHEPRVPYTFTRDVVTALEEAGGHRVPLWNRYGLPLATAAALLLAITVLPWNRADVPEKSLTQGRTADGNVGIPLDSETIVDRLELMIAQDADAESIVAGMILADTEGEETTPEDVFLAMSNEEWILAFADEWEDAEDIDTALTGLNATESDVLFDILTDYARGGYAL